MLALAADDKDARSGLVDIVTDGLKLVDSHDSLDLWEESFKESEVPASDSLDRSIAAIVCASVKSSML